MMQDLATLAPSVIVCVAFLVGTWAIVRKELAPKRGARARARAGAVAAEEELEHADDGQGGS